MLYITDMISLRGTRELDGRAHVLEISHVKQECPLVMWQSFSSVRERPRSSAKHSSALEFMFVRENIFSSLKWDL